MPVNHNPKLASIRRAGPALRIPTPTLRPENIESLDGYAQNAGYVAAAATAMDTMYKGLEKIIEAREASKKNPAWTEAAQVINVANLASKIQQGALRMADATLATLAKGIGATETALRAPLEAAATATPLAAEIRAHVKALKVEERQTFLADAVSRADTRTLGAVFGAPTYLSGTTDEQRDYFTHKFNVLRDPGAAKRLEVMQAAREKLEAASSLFLVEVQRAMNVDWDMVKKLTDAKAEAEKPFVGSDAQ